MQLLFILDQNEWKCLVLQVLVKLSVLLLVFCCGIISFHNRLTTGITRRIEVHLKFCYFFCFVRVIITPVLPLRSGLWWCFFYQNCWTLIHLTIWWHLPPSISQPPPWIQFPSTQYRSCRSRSLSFLNQNLRVGFLGTVARNQINRFINATKKPL